MPRPQGLKRRRPYRAGDRQERPAPLRAAAEIIYAAREIPADAALRNALKKSDADPGQKREITRLVFAWYRWVGWLNASEPLEQQLAAARELHQAFIADPAVISDAELRERAVPAWAHQAAELSPATLREYQREPRLWLRARPGQGAEVAEAIGSCSPHPFLPEALQYFGNDDLFRIPPFRSGLFEIQDISSQAVGLICAPAPGQTWWDACAGEGGKTLHLADLMANRGMVWSTDRAAWRLEKLKKRAARARLFNFRTRHWPNFAHLPLKARVDGLLVDAPCSGLGTWGRNPHARWSVTPHDLAELALIQKQLLGMLAAALKPGGRLIYSVCTLAKVETVEVSRHFEESHPEFTRLELPNPLAGTHAPCRDLWLLPHETQGNGMYIAAWQRK